MGVRCRPPRQTDTGRIPALDACSLAASFVKRAGMVHVWSSMKSEACYYLMPGRFGVLRIATHTKGGRNPDLRNGPTLVSVTFPEVNLRGFSTENVENQAANAIGLYLIRAGTKEGMTICLPPSSTSKPSVTL